MASTYISTWPGLNPACVFPSRRGKTLPFPLNSSSQTRFFAARYGIYHLFRSLQTYQPGAVLVPDYHHGNEVRAIRAAGAAVRFYRIGRDMQPRDLSELEQMLDSGTKALYVIHYLGWPQPIEQLAAMCRRRGVLLVEDCALSMLSDVGGQPLGSFGDYSVFCLYKTVPVPNGGVLVQNRNVLPELLNLPLRSCGLPSVLSRSMELILERLRSRANGLGTALLDLKRKVGSITRSYGAKRLPIGDAGFDRSHLDVGVSGISNRLLSFFNYEQIRERRRANYEYLASSLQGKAMRLFPELPPGVCPLFFPVLVRDKPSAARRLWDRGIGAVEFWNDGDPEADVARSPDAHYLRRHVLELPIHQDVSLQDIDYMAGETLKLELL